MPTEIEQSSGFHVFELCSPGCLNSVERGPLPGLHQRMKNLLRLQLKNQDISQLLNQDTRLRSNCKTHLHLLLCYANITI